MDDEPTCTFCGAKKSQVRKMVTNTNGAFICDVSALQAKAEKARGMRRVQAYGALCHGNVHQVTTEGRIIRI